MKSEIGGRKAEGRHLCQGNVWQGNLNPSGGTPLEPASGDGCATGWMALPGGASQSWGLSELVPPKFANLGRNHAKSRQITVSNGG